MRSFCVLEAFGRMGRKDEAELRKTKTLTEKRFNIMLWSNLCMNLNPFQPASYTQCTAVHCTDIDSNKVTVTENAAKEVLS